MISIKLSNLVWYNLFDIWELLQDKIMYINNYQSECVKEYKAESSKRILIQSQSSDFMGPLLFFESSKQNKATHSTLYYETLRFAVFYPFPQLEVLLRKLLLYHNDIFQALKKKKNYILAALKRNMLSWNDWYMVNIIITTIIITISY